MSSSSDFNNFTNHCSNMAPNPLNNNFQQWSHPHLMHQWNQQRNFVPYSPNVQYSNQCYQPIHHHQPNQPLYQNQYIQNTQQQHQMTPNYNPAVEQLQVNRPSQPISTQQMSAQIPQFSPPVFPIRSVLPQSKQILKTTVKRRRTKFTTEQLEHLESIFARNPYIARNERQILAQQLSVTDNAIKLWFQNRRIRAKRDSLEATDDDDSGIYPGNSPLPMSPPHSVAEGMKIVEDLIHLFAMNDIKANSQVSPIPAELVDFSENQWKILQIPEENELSGIAKVLDQVLPKDFHLLLVADTEHQENMVIGSPALKVDTVQDEESKAAIKIKSDLPLTDVPSTTNDAQIVDYAEISDDESPSYTGCMYEPISPAEPEIATNIHTCDEEMKMKLQKLFDKHFC